MCSLIGRPKTSEAAPGFLSGLKRSFRDEELVEYQNTWEEAAKLKVLVHTCMYLLHTSKINVESHRGNFSCTPDCNTEAFKYIHIDAMSVWPFATNTKPMRWRKLNPS